MKPPIGFMIQDSIYPPNPTKITVSFTFYYKVGNNPFIYLKNIIDC